jgi:hypothetical protein
MRLATRHRSICRRCDEEDASHLWISRYTQADLHCIFIYHLGNFNQLLPVRFNGRLAFGKKSYTERLLILDNTLVQLVLN